MIIIIMKLLRGSTLDYKIISDDEVGGYKEVVDSDEIIKNLKYFIDSRR